MEPKERIPIASTLGEFVNLAFVPGSYTGFAARRMNEGLWRSDTYYTKYIRPCISTGIMELVRIACYAYFVENMIE